MALVTAEIEEGVSTVYDHNMYTGLASGRMQGQSEEDIIAEAARITNQLRAKTIDYAEALAMTRGNGQQQTDPVTGTTAAPIVPPTGTAVPGTEIVPAPAPAQAVVPAATPENLFLPNVRVTYEGSFGVMRTRYHSVEMSGEFMVLTFDKRCQRVDMYAPPSSGEVLVVTVGDGESAQKYYATAMGINLDLDPKTINRYIIVLGILPSDHELVLELQGTNEPLLDGDLGPAMTPSDSMPPALGGLGQSSL